MRPTLWLGMILLLAMPLSKAMAQQSSELHGGRWIDVAAPTTSQAVDPALLSIEELLQNHRTTQARDSAIIWLKSHRDSPLYDRGLYLMAEALYQYGDRFKAFFYLDELLDQHQESPLFYQALEKQYQIADDYLNGYKRRFLKMPMFHAYEEAIEMLFRIQQRSPRSPIAEKALLRTADYYYASAEYDLASDAYRAYVESYPRSPNVPRVKLRRAYANLAQFRGLRFDATPVIEAKAQLQEIVSLYPDLANEENIPAVIDRIDNTFARKLAVTADFYRRTHEPRAAAYTYEFMLKNYPNTTESMSSRAAMDRATPQAPTTAP